MLIKIGLLAPNSNYLPFLARNIHAAIELGLAENPGVEYELLIEPGGYNADRQVLEGKIQELLVKHQVDVVVAPLNVGSYDHVVPHCSSQSTPLIVLSLGEDVACLDSLNPHLFVNSFNLWQSAWMTGYWGAERYGRKACSMAALHDGGYGMSFSFAIGLEGQGGTVVQSAVTHRESRDEDPSESLRMIAENHPDFIMGFYSGREAVSFLKAYRGLGQEKRIPLVGLPFMVDAALLDEVGDMALGIKTVSCWSRTTPRDAHFTKAFEAKAGRPVDCYSLLAYETGHLIAQAALQIGEGNALLGQLPDALKAVEFDGPRGVIAFDSETGEVRTTDHLREVVKCEDGKYHNKIIETLEVPPLFHEQLGLARKNLAKQGWLNPYLIA